MQDIIALTDGVARLPEWQLAAPSTFRLSADEHIAIIGHNGSGKTLLTDMLTGRHPLHSGVLRYDFSPCAENTVSACLRYIKYKDAYGRANDRSYYLQQRWNQTEIDESTPTVKDRIEQAYTSSGKDTAERRQMRDSLTVLLHMEDSMDKYIISLSSGELRKLSLITALMAQPRVLMIDNPFIGLDTEARQQFKEILHTISVTQTLQIVLIVNDVNDIPDFVTHIVEIADKRVAPKCTRTEYIQQVENHKQDGQNLQKRQTILKNPYKNKVSDDSNVICMKDVTIRYGSHTILSNVNWTVKRGECWALTGRNGSGKSTLLSLICADNPQAYRCDITLFGRKRGTGESIWDIKRRIGYVSPEMHRAIKTHITAEKIIISGLQVPGMRNNGCSEADLEKCHSWMDIFGIRALAQRPFQSLSSGEQRMVLLAKAFIADPELLILDEPFQGLDPNNRLRAQKAITGYCADKDKTLIFVTHDPNELPPCVTLTKHLGR